jgi:hypothetical protein
VGWFLKLLFISTILCLLRRVGGLEPGLVAQGKPLKRCGPKLCIPGGV